MRIVLGQELAFYLPRREVCHCPYFSKGYENGMLGWNAKTAFHLKGFDVKSFHFKYEDQKRISSFKMDKIVSGLNITK